MNSVGVVYRIEVKECMNSVRVCTGDKEITKSHKNGITN